MKPRARKQGLVLKELPDEMLVYDLEHHRAHCLNRTAALVFKQCDGSKGVGELAEFFRNELGAPADEKLVWLALEQLGRADLLQERLRAPSRVGPHSRRELIRRMGLGLAALLPLVTSIVAPTPAEASATCVTLCTGIPNLTPCGDCIDDCCWNEACCPNCNIGNCS
jgi:hypothetical protein